MEKSYRFRLYPDTAQAALMQRTFGCSRFVYNYYLAKRIELYQKSGQTLSYVACSKNLTQLKTELVWLREVDSMALQSSLQNLDRAYQDFFRRVKRGGVPGFPRFKSKRDNRRSYKTKQHGSNIQVLDKHIKLPKLGLVQCAISKQVEGRILSATVSQAPSGKYFVSICCTEVEIGALPSTGAVVGVDIGLRSLAVTSDGTVYPNHKYLVKAQKKLAKLQRQLSRKTKGSSNREKARVKVARLHEKVANQRSDMLHKLSTQLVRGYDIICIEDLGIQGMMKDRRVAKSIADASWGELRRQLTYKAAWYGKRVVVLDRAFPSNRLCAVCGGAAPDVAALPAWRWTCPHCGAEHERNSNSANNILMEGLRLLA